MRLYLMLSEYCMLPSYHELCLMFYAAYSSPGNFVIAFYVTRRQCVRMGGISVL